MSPNITIWLLSMHFFLEKWGRAKDSSHIFRIEVDCKKVQKHTFSHSYAEIASPLQLNNRLLACRTYFTCPHGNFLFVPCTFVACAFMSLYSSSFKVWLALHDGKLWNRQNQRFTGIGSFIFDTSIMSI